MRRTLYVWLFLPAALIMTPAYVLGQCYLPVSGPATLSRTSGNEVSGRVDLQNSGTVQGDWAVTATARMMYRSNAGSPWMEITSHTGQEVVIYNGTLAWRAGFGSGTVLATLEPRSNGDYQITWTAQGKCGGNSYNITPQNPPPSPIISVTRPAITGPGGTAGPYGIWWLGGSSDSANGYYNSATLSANRNGAPGTATWTVVSGAPKVSLSCNQCDYPLVTSAAPSANCTYDVSIQLNFGGFKAAAPYQMNVNSPFYMQSGGFSTTDDFMGSGWITVVPYINRDRCNYPMSSIAMNETFGPFQNMTPNNWAKPSAKGLAGYGGQTWYDNIFFYDCPGCNPVVQLGNPPDQQWVDQALQQWYIGAATPGLGIYVQQNTFSRYTGHGEHTNVTRINF